MSPALSPAWSDCTRRLSPGSLAQVQPASQVIATKQQRSKYYFG
jgi:hypothetical protein